MAPRSRARRREMVVPSGPSPSVNASSSATAAMPELASAPAHLPSHRSSNPRDSPKSTRAGSRNGMLEGPGGQEQQYVDVLGERIPVPRTYDIDSYDPEAPVPWTPEPEPYDPETYAAWGRRRFGEEWHKRRQTMLQERNFYRDPPEPVYKQRQRFLRDLEKKVEGRPTLPAWTWNVGYGEEWNQLWARLSKDLPPTEIPESPPRHENGSDTDLSGYDTYAPTPDPSYEPTPRSNDPWERLEEDRIQFRWGEEQYQHHKISLREHLVSERRRRYEDEPGDRQRKEELDEIQRMRVAPLDPQDNNAWWRQSGEIASRVRRFDRLAKGATAEQLDAEDRESHAKAQVVIKEREERKRLGPRNEEEMNDLYGHWDMSGISREEQHLLARMYGFYHKRPATLRLLKQPAAKRPPPKTQEEMDELVRQWDLFGTLTLREKNEVARMYGFDDRPAANREGHAGSQERRPSRSLRANDAVLEKTRGGRITKNTRRQSSALSGNTQADAPPQHRERRRKTYTKERASRRQAALTPEFGLLPERSRARPLRDASLPRPSGTEQARSLAARTGKPSKKPTKVARPKPQGISKSKKQAGAGGGRSRRLARS